MILHNIPLVGRPGENSLTPRGRDRYVLLIAYNNRTSPSNITFKHTLTHCIPFPLPAFIVLRPVPRPHSLTAPAPIVLHSVRDGNKHRIGADPGSSLPRAPLAPTVLHCVRDVALASGRFTAAHFPPHRLSPTAST